MVKSFNEEIRDRVKKMSANEVLTRSATDFMKASVKAQYSYNFHWLGRPIIQYPQDIVAMQELIWSTKPDLIIEMGIAHGGSLIFSASMLALLDMCDGIESNIQINPKESRRKVLGVDVDIRAHNRVEIEGHPISGRIEMIEGSSIDPAIAEQVARIAEGYERVMVCLDSNHTHQHVLKELQLYANLTSVGSYCVVFDTLIENMEPDAYPDRPWGVGDNPLTAVNEFLEINTDFEIDRGIDARLQLSVAPHGYLRRMR